jgi:hypothetical protein
MMHLPNIDLMLGKRDLDLEGVVGPKVEDRCCFVVARLEEGLTSPRVVNRLVERLAMVEPGYRMIYR